MIDVYCSCGRYVFSHSEDALKENKFVKVKCHTCKEVFVLSNLSVRDARVSQLMSTIPLRGVDIK